MVTYMQVVLLDEASQMSEPVSLLPIARFACHKLLLLGDPKVTYSIEGVILHYTILYCIVGFLRYLNSVNYTDGIDS